MFIIKKTFRFEAGHVLPYHNGKCRNPHGHSYTLEVEVRSSTLQPTGPQEGMVIDFAEISSLVKDMIRKYLDHKWLNESLNMETTTAECIAKWIFLYLEPNLPQIYAVTLHETPTSSARYTKNIE